MNLGQYLANIILEAEDQPTIALFPGAFKPPHKDGTYTNPNLMAQLKYV